MDIAKKQDGTTLILSLSGRLDTTTAPELEKACAECMEGVEKLVMDLGNVSYISSAGLRVLLSVHKKMRHQGGLVLRKVNGEIMDIFEMTGFTDVMTIES